MVSKMVSKIKVYLSTIFQVFSWGEGDDGKLGHGSRNNQDRPRVVEALRGKQVIS